MSYVYQTPSGPKVILRFYCICILKIPTYHIVSCAFPCSYLSDGVNYLQASLRKEKERPAAFKAMGLMVYVLKDRMDLKPVLNMVRSNLPTPKDITAK